VWNLNEKHNIIDNDIIIYTIRLVKYVCPKLPISSGEHIQRE